MKQTKISQIKVWFTVQDTEHSEGTVNNKHNQVPPVNMQYLPLTQPQLTEEEEEKKRPSKKSLKAYPQNILKANKIPKSSDSPSSSKVKIPGQNIIYQITSKLDSLANVCLKRIWKRQKNTTTITTKSSCKRYKLEWQNSWQYMR